MKAHDLEHDTRVKEMSTATEQICDLCRHLSRHAALIGAFSNRRPEQDHEAGVRALADQSLWGGTIGGRSEAQDGALPWYRSVEELYGRLDRLIRLSSPSLCEAIFGNPELRGMLPDLHRLRAAYEYEKELHLAQAILQQPDSAARLAGLLKKEIYWTLWPALRRALQGRENLLVIGCGPLPLTALTIAAELGIRVTCVERQRLGHALACEMIAIAGLGQSLRCIETDAVELTGLDAYDAIMPATLLGVPMEGEGSFGKQEGIAYIVAQMTEDTRLIIRDPHDLGRLLYPPVDLRALPGLEVERLVAPSGPAQPYRLSVIVGRHRGARQRGALTGSRQDLPIETAGAGRRLEGMTARRHQGAAR